MRAATTIVARDNRVERLKFETFKFLSQCMPSSIDAFSVSESSDTESKETLSLRRKKVTSNAPPRRLFENMKAMYSLMM